MKPHTIFAECPDGKALHQFYEALKHPAIVRGAVMPDVHLGMALPIGGVVASDGMVFPAFVGTDGGCGVCAVRTSFSKEAIIAFRDEIFRESYRVIPVGFSRHPTTQKWNYADKLTPVTERLLADGGTCSLGSLGSGNHFSEYAFDEANNVWFVVHSGSRGLGAAVAKHYMSIASGTGEPLEGCYGLDVDTPVGRDYLTDLDFLMAFALENRLRLVKAMGQVVAKFTPGELDMDSLINRSHNHALKSSDGLWIHRKGATHAEEGMLGIIPGNNRDGSFVVRGKGNPDSLFSSSHGAGRVMSRGQAKKTLDLEAYRQEMEALGIKALINQSTLDEAPGAYKNVWEVMAQQKDLVEVIHHLKPLISIKAGKLESESGDPDEDR